MTASRMFLPMNRQIKKVPKRPIEEILQRKGTLHPINYIPKPTKHSKSKNVYKTRTQLLQDFLKNQTGPLTLQNSKFLNAQVKMHQRRKEEANKKHRLVVIEEPTRTIFKPKSPPKAKAKSPPKAKAKAKSPKKDKCTTPRCQALKMKNQKVCDAKIKNGGEFCKRHRKK